MFVWQAKQQWTATMSEMTMMKNTWPMSKVAVSTDVLQKVLQEPDAFFNMKTHLKNKRIPPNMRFKNHHNALELISSYLPWLLDQKQVIQHMNIK